MALILKDRVKQQTTTTGSTDAYVLSGSFDGFDAFTEIGDGNETYYCCTDGTDFEVGRGTFTASGTTLSRAVLSSSNSGAAVNWTSGTRTIFCTQPADKAVFLDGSGNISIPGTIDGRDLATDGSKLDGIESGATADQTKTDIDALNIDAATLDGIDSTSFLRSDADDSFSNQIDGTTLELAGGVTYDPPGSTGSDTATDVGLALQSGARVVMGNSGFIRTIIDATASQPLQFGQSGTGYFAGTNIFGGSQGVKLHYNADGRMLTTSDGISVLSSDDNGPVINLISNDPADVADFTTEAQIKFFAENDASEQTQYATIFLSTGDVTDGIEDGWMYFQTMNNGSLTNTAAVSPNSFYLLNSDSQIIFNDWGGTSHRITITPSTPTADRTITLPDATGTVLLADGDGSSLTSVDAATLDGINSTSFLRSDAADSFSGALTGTGAVSTTSYLESGRGSGGVALTVNDGYGNANVTFNHRSGVPEQTGRAGRIEVNTDETSGNATMYFELGNATANTAVSLPIIMSLSTSVVDINTTELNVDGNLDLNGTSNTSGVATFQSYLNRTTGAGNSAWLQQDGTGRVHWYWNTVGGSSPTYNNGNEEAAAITLNGFSGTGGEIKFRVTSANNNPSAGDAITWIEPATFRHNKINLKKNTAVTGDLDVSGDLDFEGALIEKAYNLTGTALDPSNGTLQYKTLSANTTFTESFVDGESITLMIDDGSSYTVTWPTMTWASGSAPTLATSGYTTVVLWHRGGLYGAVVS